MVYSGAEEKDMKQEKQRDKSGRRFPAWLREWVLPALLVVAIVLPVRAFAVDWMPVQGDSMKNTLQDGECMLVTKYDYLLGDPERFDVVICHYEGRGNTHFVKRVVGIPGDTVAVRGGTLYVNGEAVDEPYIDYPPDYTLEETTVEAGHYFVLGDNRANSNDSHVPTVGQIARDDIVAHVRYVFWPLNSMRAIE